MGRKASNKIKVVLEVPAEIYQRIAVKAYQTNDSVEAACMSLLQAYAPAPVPLLLPPAPVAPPAPPAAAPPAPPAPPPAPLLTPPVAAATSEAHDPKPRNRR